MNFGKKILLSLVVTGATTGLAFAAGGQGQGSGQVQFHGYIIDAPCSIVSDDPIKVEFGQISKKALSVNDNTGESHIKPFNIELADCTFDDGTSGSYVGNQLTVTFSYNDAGNATGQVTNLVGFDGAANMGAGVVIVSGNTKVENNKALPPRLLVSLT